ncbi:helix-turn-helix transcriptional regulator [Methylomonas fluvii]|uniref:helix-turn-helix transcriptional regulator n=2 Tax=Methylomonas fluvii TaxID=1854564 RepID=UPI001CAA830B
MTYSLIDNNKYMSNAHKRQSVLRPIMIDLEAVSEVTGLSESTIQSLIRADEFPKPRKASARRTCWLLREIEEWAESRPVSDLLPPPNTATGGRNGKPKARNALLVTQDAPID